MTDETKNYRPDIDGLRAIAVASVLLFHAFPDTVSGGFVGVDIFFVISGFLITSILVKEAETGRFSIVRFYIRRARRIFPALLVVLGAALAIGFLILLPNEWTQLGGHVAAGSVFASNIRLWLESGYFDTASDLKPLLHLWSLAVEEQYYLVWPVIIFIGVRFGRPALIKTAIGLGAFSLLASIWLTPQHPSMSFFFPITRLWELLAGSSLALLHSDRNEAYLPLQSRPVVAEALGLIGTLCVASSIFWFDRNTVFPGYAAILPVLGAALLIAAGPETTINRAILSNRYMVGVGLISYPLYLWHWPLLAFSRIWFSDGISAIWRAGMLTLAFVLAWLTYRWIETPIRNPARSSRAARDAAILWVLLLLLGALGLASWANWLPARSSRNLMVNRVTEAELDWGYVADKTWPGNLPGRVLFVGDSHMQQYAPRIDAIMSRNSGVAHTATLITLGGCAPVLGITRRSIDCARFSQAAFDEMSAPDVVTIVIAASWRGLAERPDYYRIGDASRSPIEPLADSTHWILDEWQSKLGDLTRSGKHVVVLLSNPRGSLVMPRQLLQRSLWSWEQITAPPPSEDALKQIVTDADNRVATAARSAGAEIVYPFDAFCRAGICPVVTSDGDPIFIDDSHIRASYVRDKVKYLDRYLLTGQ